MPYKIEKDGDQFCVVKEGADGGRMKCYDNRADATDYLKALYAAENKQFVPPEQAEVNYLPLSATPGQACANCRWFKAVEWEEDGPEVKSECHLIASYPEAIVPTGRCDRWEAVPEVNSNPLPVVIVDAPSGDMQQGEAAFVVTQTVVDAGGKSVTQIWEGLQATAAKYVRKLRQSRDELSNGMKVVGNAWLITWSNNFEDRDGEIFTQKAIDQYVARVDRGIVPPPELWVWHTPGTRIGQAAWVGRHGHFVMAAGEFDETPQAQAAKAYYQRHAQKTGVSHGFTFPAATFDGKHYHDFNTFEITLLPRDAEANRFTSLEGVKAMALDEKKRANLEAVFGKEQAEKILNDLEARGKALEETGVAFKDYVDATGDEAPSAAVEAVEAVEADIKALIGDLIGDSAEEAQQRAAAAKAFTALAEQVQTLRTEVAALKEIVDLKPRSASADKDTQVTNDALVADIQKQFAKVDAFWGTEVNTAP